jgi:hypothetical protein
VGAHGIVAGTKGLAASMSAGLSKPAHATPQANVVAAGSYPA